MQLFLGRRDTIYGLTSHERDNIMETDMNDSLTSVENGEKTAESELDAAKELIGFSPNRGMPPLSKEQAVNLVRKHSAKIRAQFAEFKQ